MTLKIRFFLKKAQNKKGELELEFYRLEFL